jgi:hypothetical protein
LIRFWILFGLRRLGLIDSFTYGSTSLNYNEKGDTQAGVRITPSMYGAELFLWVYGYLGISTKHILSSDKNFKIQCETFLPKTIIPFPKKDNEI